MAVLLNPNTKVATDAFIKKPAQSLLIVGSFGSGKVFVAQNIAQEILQHNNLETYAFYDHIQPTDGTISIGTIRELKNFLQLKTTGNQDIRRVVLIEDAESMNQEAQNALLKILEEPPTDTVLLLTASNVRGLLQTIISRVQKINLQKVPKEQLFVHFASYPKAEVEKTYHMSDGQVGLMHALLQSDTEQEHPLVKYINLAKDLFQKTAYQRLLMINDLQKEDLGMLATGLYSVAHAALMASAEKEDKTKVKKWYRTCKVIHKIQDELKYKPQSKLVLTDLLVNL